MLPIIKDFIKINRFSRVGRKLLGKKGIVMHYTATPGAPAMNISNYFDNLGDQDPYDDEADRYAGAQYSVDRYKIVQSMPDDEEAFHTGSKVGYTAAAKAKLGAHPNKTTVGIEMCIEKDGSIHEDTFRNAADLVTYLIKERGFPEDSIWTHKGVVGWKDCPLPWIKKPSEFERFKKAVHDRLYPPVKKVAPPPPKSVEEDEDSMAMKLESWAWASIRDYLDKAVQDGILKDPVWVKKAEDKTLTAAELAYLNTEITRRTIAEIKEAK